MKRRSTHTILTRMEKVLRMANFTYVPGGTLPSVNVTISKVGCETGKWG